jgi:multiple sugar transport system substrate-binding protein
MCLLCCLLCGLILAGGCGDRASAQGSDHADGRVHLTLAVAAGLSDRPSYEWAIRNFMAENPRVLVEMIEVPGNYYQKLLVMIAGRNAPDLMWMGQGFGEFARRGVFLDMTERIVRDVDISQYNADACGWYRLDGRQYAVPFGEHLKLMIYNQDLFDQAGVNYPRDNWTFEEFLAKAKALTRDDDHDGVTDTYGFRGELDVSLFGAHFISSDGLRATCDTPGMVEYLQVNHDLANVYRVAPPGKTVRTESMVEDSVSLFQQRNAAIMQIATWHLPFLYQRCANMRWAMVANPSVNGRRTHWASSEAIMVSAETRHPDEAWAMARMFLGDDFQRAAAESIVPSKRSIAEELARRPSLQRYNPDALRVVTGSMIPFPRVAHLSELAKLWTDSCESVWIGRATPADAARRAQREITRGIRTQQAMYQ